MLDTLLSFGVAFLLIWVIIYIHEFGHYYAGREIVGIPSDSIRIVDPYFPRYVALRDDEEWVSPTDLTRYQRVYEQYDPEGEHVERFVAAGELVQAGVVVPIAVAIGVFVSVDVAVAILWLSLLSTAVYVGIDILATLYTGSPSGDYSVLWQTTPKLPLFLLLGFASMHVIPLYVFL